MNKRHWHSISFNSDVDNIMLKVLFTDSRDMKKNKLPKNGKVILE